MDVTDPSQNHPAVDGAYSRDGHDDRIEAVYDICHFGFNVVDLAIKEFDLLDRMDYLDSGLAWKSISGSHIEIQECRVIERLYIDNNMAT